MLELGPEVVDLLESDAIVLVGTVDAEGMPDATRAWGVRVTVGDSPRFRCLLPLSAERAYANLGTTARIALTVTDAQTLQSAQVKGIAIAIEPATDEDQAEAMRFFDAVSVIIEGNDGTPREMLAPMRPGALNAIVATIEECYDQTPGPAAGAPA